MDAREKIDRLPEHVRDALARKSIPELIEIIDGSGFEDTGGPLVNRIEWLELKARVATLAVLIPDYTDISRVFK